VVASTAIEAAIPDLRAAAARGLRVLHRADVLARHVREHKTAAVAGTSGKSTVTAMIFEILEAAGLGPSVITGAPLNSLKARGLLGNALRGDREPGWLVVEADESDGTLPKYEPWLGVLLNMTKDHKELSELSALFGSFQERCERFVVNADGQGTDGFLKGAVTFGFRSGEVRAQGLETDGRGSRFSVDGVRFELPLPGSFNAENALAAAAACLQAGVPLETAARALAVYKGVERRFERVGEARGVEVIDDYAHNPDKVRAVFSAAHARGRRVLAVYQLHGFAPTRFLKNEFIEAFAASLGEEDVLWMPEIYYAGGTTTKDVCAEDIAGPVRSRGRDVRTGLDREHIARDIAENARPGDLVLMLGARDPTLSEFSRDVFVAVRDGGG